MSNFFAFTLRRADPLMNTSMVALHVGQLVHPDSRAHTMQGAQKQRQPQRFPRYCTCSSIRQMQQRAAGFNRPRYVSTLFGVQPPAAEELAEGE